MRRCRLSRQTEEKGVGIVGCGIDNHATAFVAVPRARRYDGGGAQGASGSADRAEPTWYAVCDLCSTATSFRPVRRTTGTRKEVAMPTAPLPEQPDLDQLRKRARELQRAVRAGDAAAVAFVTEHRATTPPGPRFPLAAAQSALAHHHRFSTWALLRRHVEVINARTWTLPEPPADEGPADRFLRLACLNYAADDPASRAEAARLLTARPDLPREHAGVAAACADVAALRRLVAADPGAATAACGPFGWSPLLYQAYARHDPDVGLSATLGTAELLLDAGADPNDGRFFLGLPTPFTVLTGVFAANWHGQPAHPHAVAFARLLLRAGADPNDGQTLYNRMFGPDDDHLVVLFEFGLGRPTGGPWHRLLGDQLESPAVMLASLLDWAVSHDQRARVDVLAAHGVDVVGPIAAPRRSSTGTATPVEIALVNGNRTLAARLHELGAAEPRLDAADTFVGAVLSGDRPAVESTPPDVVAEAIRRRPGLVVWAASRGRVTAVELAVAAGFSVNALGRLDAPVEDEWQTALHAAVDRGDAELARRLLSLGADPGLRDRHRHATPLDWAREDGRSELVDVLTEAEWTTSRRSTGG
jgi:ankyrin repeat protein